MLKAVSSALSIDRADWDRLANPEGGEFNPLVSHDFFRCLEESGCAVAATGWAPRHLVMEQDGEVTGIVPCYRKRHSYGEYVFDHGWANAYRAGGRALLSQATGLGTLLARDRPPPVRGDAKSGGAILPAD